MNKLQEEIDIFTKSYNMLGQKVESWFHKFVLMVPNFIIAVVVFLAFNLVARLIRNILIRILIRTTLTKEVVRIISRIAYVAVSLVGVFFCLGILQLDKTVTSLLAGAGIIGLALSFAFQDIATNLISGFILAIKKPFKVGDLVETNGFVGTISEIDIRAIHLKNYLGQDVIIPSKEVLQKPIINYTTYGERRVEIKVNICFEEDLNFTREATKKSLESLTEIDKTRGVEVFFDGFVENGVVMVVRFWINLGLGQDFTKAKNDAIIKIHEALKESEIAVSNPLKALKPTNRILEVNDSSKLRNIP